MTNRFDRILTVVLTLSAAGVAVSALRNSFSPPPRAGAREAPDYVKSWKNLVPAGHSLAGDSSAAVNIVVFFDLECPACAGFHSNLKQVLVAHPTNVRAVYVPFPLPYHRMASPAAKAAECAASVGRFAPFVDAVIAGRDSLGLKSWGRFAQDAGIADTARIGVCAADATPNARIDAGLALGQKIGLEGTPTVLVNGWRYHGTPSAAMLDTAIAIVLRGGHPK